MSLRQLALTPFSFAPCFIALCLVASSFSFLASSIAQAERLSPERLWDMKRIGDSAVSPDGSQVAYLVTKYNLSENKGTASLLVQDLPGDLSANAKSKGFESDLIKTEAKVLLKDIKGLHGLNWLNHSSGPKLVYIAPAEMKAPESKGDDETEEEGSEPETVEKPQAWLLDPTGGDPVQLTSVEEGIGNLKAAPSGDAIAFTVDITLDKTVTEIYEDLPKADARIIDSLMYRHWNQWHDYAYSHLHVTTINAKGVASEPIDLMASMKADCPVPPFGGSEQFTFSPDGKEIALTLKLVNNPAESTDTNV